MELLFNFYGELDKVLLERTPSIDDFWVTTFISSGTSTLTDRSTSSTTKFTVGEYYILNVYITGSGFTFTIASGATLLTVLPSATLTNRGSHYYLIKATATSVSVTANKNIGYVDVFHIST